MKTLIIAAIMAMSMTPIFCEESEGRAHKAAKISSDIIVARILETSPVAHGSNGVTMSLKVQLIRHLKGSSPFTAHWITYSVSKDSESFGTDFETSLKKNDERILFVTKSTLLRAEALDQESTIKSIIKNAQQVAPRNR